MGFPCEFPRHETNLKAAAAGENEEHADMYPEFERIAREEGFKEIACVFHEIAEVEERHERRFLKLLANIENDEVFKKPEEVEWKMQQLWLHPQRHCCSRLLPSLRSPNRSFRSL